MGVADECLARETGVADLGLDRPTSVGWAGLACPRSDEQHVGARADNEESYDGQDLEIGAVVVWRAVGRSWGRVEAARARSCNWDGLGEDACNGASGGQEGHGVLVLMLSQDEMVKGEFGVRRNGISHFRGRRYIDYTQTLSGMLSTSMATIRTGSVLGSYSYHSSCKIFAPLQVTYLPCACAA